MEVRNLRPWPVEIPNVGTVDAGGTIEVDDDLGDNLALQEDAWANVAEGTTVKDVLADVGDDPGKARQALALEAERDRPRKSLVSRLEEIAANDEETG